MTHIPTFYPLVDSADWVKRLLPLGVKLIQLRIKQQPDDKLRAEITAALAACRQAGAQLVINDHWQLAIELGATFVHLGQDDLPYADQNALKINGIKLGVSTHNRKELVTALAVEPAYIALGPIFPTSSKQTRAAPQGTQRISEWKRLIGNTPLVAIGGISLEKAPDCYAAGADSIAVISDIQQAADWEGRVRQWMC